MDLIEHPAAGLATVPVSEPDIRSSVALPAPRPAPADELWFRGPGGEQLSLPGAFWPELACSQNEPIAFAPISLADANLLCERWHHPLGACNRKYGSECWGMAVDGHPVAVAIGASTVGPRVGKARLHPLGGTYLRQNVVDLARIARAPDHPRALRAMLRLWTEYLARRWRYWPIIAAVSYALPGKHGNLHRFDQWTCYGKRGRSGGRPGFPSRLKGMGDERPKLYVYDYRPLPAEHATVAPTPTRSAPR